jgi:hypothetical protein
MANKVRNFLRLAVSYPKSDRNTIGESLDLAHPYSKNDLKIVVRRLVHSTPGGITNDISFKSILCLVFNFKLGSFIS